MHSIKAHTDDINTIGFVQREQTSVILSGSDDGLVKVWDIRALGLSQTPVGILHGHQSGLTYVDSRNDSIYVCSNGKDHVRCPLHGRNSKCGT
jgi:DDB1- and CUL4-associated factor 11